MQKTKIHSKSYIYINLIYPLISDQNYIYNNYMYL